jgi:MFS family permease
MGALSCMVFVNFAATAWTPAFFARRFGWDGARLGGPYGVLLLFCGGAGALCGGMLTSFLRRRGVGRANLKAALAGFLLAAPLAIGFPFAPDPYVALAIVAALSFATLLPFGGGYAALQDVTPPRMRSQFAAFNLLAVNLGGASLGPLVVGLLTDQLFHDPARVGQSIALTALIGSPLAVAGFLLAMRGYDRAVAAAEAL